MVLGDAKWSTEVLGGLNPSLHHQDYDDDPSSLLFLFIDELALTP